MCMCVVLCVVCVSARVHGESDLLVSTTITAVNMTMAQDAASDARRLALSTTALADHPRRPTCSRLSLRLVKSLQHELKHRFVSRLYSPTKSLSYGSVIGVDTRRYVCACGQIIDRGACEMWFDGNEVTRGHRDIETSTGKPEENGYTWQGFSIALGMEACARLQPLNISCHPPCSSPSLSPSPSPSPIGQAPATIRPRDHTSCDHTSPRPHVTATTRPQLQ